VIAEERPVTFFDKGQRLQEADLAPIELWIRGDIMVKFKIGETVVEPTIGICTVQGLKGKKRRSWNKQNAFSVMRSLS